MARPPRLEIPGGIYHVTARGNERAPIYWNDDDRARFLELLAKVRSDFEWSVLAHCLMTNHYHLLVRISEPNLARGMRQLNGIYAQAFNRTRGRVGHLFQGRYDARLVQADDHLRAVVRYIVRNPVRAGLCRDAQAWRWSSHRATLALEPPWFVDTTTLLAYYGSPATEARERYRAHVEQPARDEPATHPLIEGDDTYVDSMVLRVVPGSSTPRRYLRRPRPSLDVLVDPQYADATAIASAHAHGYSLREIARHVGVNVSTVSRRLSRQRCATLQT